MSLILFVSSVFNVEMSEAACCLVIFNKKKFFGKAKSSFPMGGPWKRCGKVLLFHIVSKGPPLETMVLLFQKKIFILKITKRHTASLISTLKTEETNKIKLTNYFILRMRVLIQNFTYIEKGVNEFVMVFSNVGIFHIFIFFH